MPSLKAYLSRAFAKPLNVGPAIVAEDLRLMTRKANSFQFYYFRHCWLEKAVSTFESNPGLLLDRNALRIAIDSYNNLGRVTPALSLMKQLLTLEPRDRELKRIYEYFERLYIFSGSDGQKSLD